MGFRWGLAPAFHLQTPVFACLEGFFFPRRLVDKLWIMYVALVCSVTGDYCSMGWGWISIFRFRQRAVYMFGYPCPLPEG